MTIPQYAKTTNPEVLAVIDRNDARYVAFGERAHAFSKAHGGDKSYVMVNGWGGDRHLSAIVADDKPTTGRWKSGGRRGTWEPFKNNPVRAEFDAIEYRRERIPGLAETYNGPRNRDGSQVIMTPGVFAHDGVAYMRLRDLPSSDQSGFGSDEFDHDIWTEILPSEWHAASERHTGKAVPA
ncbi:hypothetical protein Xcel_0570 [Xylanimonas cellulosilytica DSM 15894]|uniref:Uncharacterized protein n=1 Tax=Xylanimonas cellulosilytica (strain DSM 15894 / JCM 12276 / CECT 5975 / KCTC 9989 / LMG 20990 / NBRC 107835 / XIL07) TaxID=446471 RepID=D1BWM7_XYLCX|nr:hypothetical protein [Xylanimonas cellulosilytica]ACZ29609.1 hypothetical protein Xcel_0570 [Xylanimonas cellulosilytica DSM 15894]